MLKRHTHFVVIKMIEPNSNMLIQHNEAKTGTEKKINQAVASHHKIVSCTFKEFPLVVA